MAKRTNQNDLTIGQLGTCSLWLATAWQIAQRPRGNELLSRLAALANTEPDRFDVCMSGLLDGLKIGDDRRSEEERAAEGEPARILPFARQAAAAEPNGAA